MKRFMVGLTVAALVAGLSFPEPVLAAGGGATSDALSLGRVATVQAGGDAWYVATDGADGAGVKGTLDDPFATISYATTRMKGGDTVYVRGGTYRDAVTDVPSGSEGRPSTICAYQDEEVWLTGGEEVTGWERADGSENIWVADMGWDMSDVFEYDEVGVGEDAGHSTRSARYDNLVFADGIPMPEGRWPNATVDEFLDRDRYAVAERASGETLVDASLPDGVDFTGAEVWVAAGGGYESQTATITGYQPADHRLLLKSNSNSGWMYSPTSGNYYYVTKSLKTLDAAGEWYKDKEAGKLYLYEPAGVDPNELNVVAQRRAHVIRIGYGKDSKGNVTYEEAGYITFRGINARLGAVAFSPATSHCTFEQGTVDCPDHAISSQAYGVATGILVCGSDNLVTRCEVEHAYGAAITLWGERNNVVNNHVHDAGYEHHEEQAAIRIGGSGHLVSRNSVHHVMRQAITGFFESSVISYNDLYDCMRVSRDGGVVYFNAHDYGNTEFHHNWLHDTRDFPFGHQQVGLYMDSFTTSLVVYRNVVWGIQQYEEGNRDVNNNGKHLTYQLNPNSLNNVIVNNTFVNYRPTHLNFYPNHDISGTVFLNNIYQSLSFIDGATYYPWRWTDKWDRRNQKGVGGVKRDILAEMGAWFDQGHNLEGEFKNNTWPPIENQWSNPAGGDFTLAAGSRAIDAGCEIAGVTEGFVGSAPDLGAYERGGEKWVPGCDLSKDFTADLASARAFNEKIPYRNLLANRGFENWSAAQADQPAQVAQGSGSPADFAGWGESGAPRASDPMDSWGYWGWVTKEGSRHAVLGSDGDALTQHVTGLRENATYRLGGYGFVAGELVRPKMLAAAENASGPVAEGTLASLRRGNPMSLSGLTKLEFDGVDFGEGRDRVVIGLKSPKVNEGSNRQVVSVALGSPDNVVGSYEMTERLTTAEISWRWATVELNGSYEGNQDVYLVLSGSFSGTSLGGFIPDRSLSTDVLSISAVRPDGTVAGTAAMTSLFKPFEESYYAPHSAVVRTDSTGALDVKVSMRGSDLTGYVDEVFLSELPGGENFGNASACSHVFKKDTCKSEWDWTILPDTDYFDAEYTGVVTLTCAECGERVSVEAPTVSEEEDGEVVCRASYAVVGDVLQAERMFLVSYFAVSAEGYEHGTVSAPTSARRGTSISVTVKPDDGYALASLSYACAGRKGEVDISESRAFAMPAVDVTLKAAFEPVFFLRGVPDQVYSGAAAKPLPMVLFGDRELVKDVDYTVAYASNAKVGTATVTVTGQGDYAGASASTTFKVKPASISSAKVTGLGSQTYTGKAVKPAPTVKLGTVTLTATLKSGTDYTLSYTNNVKVGTATVTATGKGNYTGSKSATFKISPAGIAKAKVSSIAAKTYTGKAIKPVPTVKLGTATLKKGADYTLSYKNNVKVGIATVKVTGKGNYTGSRSATFKIAKRGNTLVVRNTVKTLRARSLAKAKGVVKPISASKARGAVTYQKRGGSKYLAVAKATGKVTVKKGTPRGVYRVKVTVKAAGNACYQSKAVTVTAKVNVR